MNEFLKSSWKAVVSIVGAIGIIMALLSVSAHFASSADLDKVKADTTSSIQELRKSMELDRDINRLNFVNDNLIKAKIQSRQYPHDKDIADDVESLRLEKEKLQNKIEKNTK